MKHSFLKKRLSVTCALTILCTGLAAIPVSLPTAAAGVSYTPIELHPAPTRDVTIAGSSTGFYSASETDVIAMQFVLTSPATAVTCNIPSFSNNTGSVTMALFAFDTDYDTTLLSSPLAELTFKDFTDGSDLGFGFDKSSPLPAGEYLLVLYDMNDPTPTANGGNGTGIGVWTNGAHEGQRAYMNGSYLADTTYPVRISYVTKPEKLYGIPTKPAAAEGIDYAPHMAGLLDFRKEENISYVGGANQTTKSFVTEDGESFLRLKASTDASDPYQFINLPGTLIKCNEYKYVLIKLRRTEGSNTQSQLFFTTDETKLSEAASVRPNYKDTTDWQYLIINLGANNNYHGLLKTLRLDYFQTCKGMGNHHVDIQYIALFKSQEAAEAFHDNFDDFQSSLPEGGDKEDPTATPDYSTYISADAPADAVAGKLTANGQLGYLYKDYPYVMTFDKTPEEYAAEGSIAFTAIDSAIVKDGRLQCKAFSTYEIYTKKFLGDDYGIRGGSMEFTMVMETGEITVTLRQIKPNDEFKYSGIRFTLTADGTLTVEERDGLTDTIKPDIDLTKEHKITFADESTSLSLLIDGKAVYTLLWDRSTKTLTTPAGKTFTAPHLADAGYATFRSARTRGYVDDFTYTYVDIVSKTVTGEHPVDYSTWVATDDLDRTTPTFTEVGEGKDKYVGLFYFMIHSDDMSSRYVNDVTRFYLEGGMNLLTGKLSSFAGRNGCYWAEPYFGYYSSHDTWVYRKHAYMLDAAGVDFIFLDVSNNKFYVEQCKILFDTWKSIRDEGGQTPQIAFMYGDMPFTLLNGLYTLLEPFYNNPDYQELLFCWEGKPLLLGNSDTPDGRTWTVSDTTPQTRQYYRDRLAENAVLNAFYTDSYTALLNDSFTVRKCWAWQAGNGKRSYGYWDWLQESPQALGTNFDGKAEQITVSMGVHAHTSRGRSYLNGDNTYNPDGNFGFTLGTARYGYFFSEQFDYALTQNVNVIMITGWNEWYAGVNVASSADQTCGQTPTPNYYMIDQMSPEYSRDGEPMKIRDGEGSVGFGDNYYYQMVSYIRKFKGLNAAPATVNGGSLSTADKTEWEKVSPAFTDTVGDTNFRSFASFSSEFLYTNGTARNDLDVAKVSQDADYLYFHITTATPLITADDELWMNLYVDADNDPATGWEGFDYIINRSRTDKTVSVEKFVDGKWVFETVGEGEYTLGESSMTIKVAKTTLGHTAGNAVSLSFKWADNADVKGDVMAFMELGDTAPNDRFVFAYTASTIEDERNQPEDTETESDTDTATEPVTQPTTELPTEPVTEPEKKKGCKSTVTASAGILTAALLGLLSCFKRRKRDE